mmetsp:Transcript_21933/g.30828  ORF Transcript_21933/g.30828 Transcript_21933/m.30828 type:complete len:120 (-) Transcript_21933:526-885(-)
MEKDSKIKMSKGRTMISKPVFKISNRKMLADFIVSLPLLNSWWCPIPSFDLSGKRPTRYTTDECIPQFGHILGIEEEAAAIVLFKMGLIRIKDGAESSIIWKGWDELKSLFKIHSCLWN